jgi:hypothetical protein
MMDWLNPALDGKAWLCILSFVLAGVLSALIGWLLYSKGLEIMVSLVGILAGGCIGYLAYTLFLSGTQSVALLIILPIVGSFIGLYLSYKQADFIMIHGTASTGAYSLLRGISVYAGGFPSEIVVFEMIQEGADLKSVPTTFYIYMVSMILCYFFGAMYQTK